jgi:ABC-type phosphate/phosphonate transport system ATPase subunit
MIELLGVGAPREDGGWLLHRIYARFRRGEITVVVSRDPAERRTLLDAVTARIVPDEGRVWVNRLPVARDTVGRIRALVAEADLGRRPVERRSLLWNVLTAKAAAHRTLHGLLRLPRKSERQAALCALERVGLGGRATEAARVLRALAHRDRLAVVVGAATAAAHGFADRLVVIAEGLLRYDGLPADFTGDRVA